MPMLRAFVIVLLGAVAVAGCGNDTTTSPTTTEVTRGTEVFGGTLGIGDSQFWSFTAVSPGTTDVTLVSLRPAGTSTTTFNTVVGLGLGIPQATDCALSNATNTTPGLKTQLTVATNVSTYCIKIADVGNLTTTVDYTIRVVHP